jgi:hypothetical protein
MNADNLTNTVAVGAIASPWWLKMLTEVSEFAAMVLPILGVAWLLIKMVAYFRNWKKPPD